ncbi:MAG TPA: sigma 54-interacting transcriptional regulator [Gemmatimonadaceae bacterium]|nr:sigma 54-interacting transcriptional regulator [Gemmatimonadaceae bacterium]
MTDLRAGGAIQRASSRTNDCENCSVRAQCGAVSGREGLSFACSALAASKDAAEILAAVPRLSLTVCPARSAHVLEIVDGDVVRVLASEGPPLATPALELVRHARGVLDPLPGAELERIGIAPPARQTAMPPYGLAHLAAAPLWMPGGAQTLVVAEREEGCAFEPGEVRDFEIFGFVAGSALSRARLHAALNASQTLQANLLGTMRESLLVLDGRGVIAGLTGSAATLIGLRFKDAIGKPLREVPGMASLALALLAGQPPPPTMRLPTGEVRVRHRRYEGGMALILSHSEGAERGDGARQLYSVDDLVGESPLIVRARRTVQQMADVELPVLLGGESGTGKEIVAQALHTASHRAREPFVAVNVAALPAGLLESELLGYERGAFTGANPSGQPGKFELAGGGTVLLDEIGEMPLDMQAKLLRVLEDCTVQRIGGGRARKFHARVIASTNRDLEQEVHAGRFRLDLLHRLRVVHLKLPPLRERKGDVPLITQHVLSGLARSTRHERLTVAPAVMHAFEHHGWPGNVRELIHVLQVEAMLLPANKDVIDTIPESLVQARNPKPALALNGEVVTLEDAEREACARALHKAAGHVPRAAKMLGVAKTTLYAKIRRYDLVFTPGESAEPSGEEQGRAEQVRLASGDD